MILNIAAGVFALLALVLLALSLRALGRRRIVRAGGLGVGGSLFALAALLAAAVALNLYTYERLTHEAPVVDVRFRALAPQLYEAVLSFPQGDSRRAELAGDEWQLDARILKWRGFATVLGLDPLYRLERLSGRYHSAAQEQSARRTVFALGAERGFDLWAAARRGGGWLALIDAVYGSAAFLPMRDGAVYRVSVTASGLIARPLNQVATDAVAQWQ